MVENAATAIDLREISPSGRALSVILAFRAARAIAAALVKSMPRLHRAESDMAAMGPRMVGCFDVKRRVFAVEGSASGM
jgi:hypothetical protein